MDKRYERFEEKTHKFKSILGCDKCLISFCYYPNRRAYSGKKYADENYFPQCLLKGHEEFNRKARRAAQSFRAWLPSKRREYIVAGIRRSLEELIAVELQSYIAETEKIQMDVSKLARAITASFDFSITGDLDEQTD